MKRMKINALCGTLLFVSVSATLMAQKIDAERMNRDIEVAENVLATLIRQKFENKRMFFHLEVNGSYQEGYGVTFTIPPDYTTPIAFSFGDFATELVVRDRWQNAANVRSHSGEDIEIEIETMPGEEDEKEKEQQQEDAGKWKLKDEKQKAKAASLDSIRDNFNARVIEASTDFLADYGDILSQLNENEKIVITNRGERPRAWVGSVVNAPSRTHLTMELSRAALNQYRQGKLTREQLITRIQVLNTETIDEAEPDLELLSSIFNQLYRMDLSKTFFADGHIYYERLKDFGVIYYMQVYSSNRTFTNEYDMPTIKMRNVSQEERDKKVAELYPVFEKELKENIIEYGRTIKSLKEGEVLIFNVKLTRCEKCGIPSSIEASVKASVLKAYGSGKVNKDAALAGVTIKKTTGQ